jgi:hypothetical protein
MDQCLQIVWRN